MVVVAAGALMIEILPIALADGQRKADSLVQGVFANGLIATEECG